MKTTVQHLTKKLLGLGLAAMAWSGAQAQCTLYTNIDNLSQGNVVDSAAYTTQAGWESYIYVDFGDGSNATTYSASASAGNYLSPHQYTTNGMYIISTYLYSYDPIDSSFNCSTSSFDTVVISGLACSVDVGTISANQNGMMGAYTFSTNVTSTNPPMIYWWIMDSLNNTIYTQTGGQTLNFTFTQNGYYQVVCAAYSYDSLTMTSCADTSFLWVPFSGNPAGGCNLNVWLDINPNSGLAVNIQGNATAAYQFSYMYIDGNYFYNTANVNYTFPTAGSYDVCFYAQDTTSATYCWDSVCVIYNTNPVQCNASFYLFQDSLTPTVWYGVNNSTWTPGTTYLWDFGDGSTSTQVYPTHTYATPGNYVICLTVIDSLNNCSSTYCDSSAAFRLTTSALMGSISILAPTGIKENNHSVNEVKLFPNPMADLSNIAFNSTVASAGKIEVVGLLGNTVLSQDVTIAKGMNEFSMNMSALANGVYYVKIVAGSEVLSTIKAVK